MNRAEQLWYNWEGKQKQLESVQGIEKQELTAIQRYRYDYLRHGLYRLSRKPDQEEKMFLQIIRSVTARIRKRLYPNPFIRAMVGLKEFFYDRPVHIGRFVKEQERSLEQLKEQFKAKEISMPLLTLEKMIETEAEKVKLEFSTQLEGEKTMQLEINIRNAVPGQIMLDGYKMHLRENGGRERWSCSFTADSDMTVKEAANLLQGRAIKKAFENTEGKIVYKWLQADRAVDNGKGDVKIMEFGENYPFDLKNVLMEFSKEIGVSELATEMVIKTLEVGNQVKFKAKDHGIYYLNVNPWKQSVDVRDGKGSEIDKAALMERIAERQKSMEYPQFSLARSMGNRIEKHQSMDFSRGI